MNEYAVCVLQSGNDVSIELLSDRLFIIKASSGINAIQGFIDRRGMAYQSEMVAFLVERIPFVHPLCTDDIAKVHDEDYWIIDNRNMEIVVFTSVCAVSQTEFPF